MLYWFSSHFFPSPLDNPLLHALEGAVPLPEQEPAFTVYDDIRQKLIVQGMPADQIAFIHEANTEVRKKELFSKVRTGQVRVLLGSTAKIYDVHHFPDIRHISKDSKNKRMCPINKRKIIYS